MHLTPNVTAAFEKCAILAGVSIEEVFSPTMLVEWDTIIHMERCNLFLYICVLLDVEPNHGLLSVSFPTLYFFPNISYLSGIFFCTNE